MVLLKYLRVRKKLTIIDVEKATGVSKSQISRFETGNFCFSRKALEKVADFFGVQPEMLSLDHRYYETEVLGLLSIPQEINTETKIIFPSVAYYQAASLLSKVKYKKDLKYVEYVLEYILENQKFGREREKVVPNSEAGQEEMDASFED